MIGYLIAAAVLVIAGVGIGVLIVICLGIHREERDKSLTQDIDSKMARGVRRLNRVGYRGYDTRASDDEDGDSYRRAA
ncbi:MAG: hypothetical protein ACRDOU_00615 [Streptosporangiaceae bacterium]